MADEVVFFRPFPLQHCLSLPVVHLLLPESGDRITPTVQPLCWRRQHTSTSSPAIRNLGSNPPIAFRASDRIAILHPGMCSASRSVMRTCMGFPGAFATHSAVGEVSGGGMFGPPMPT